METKLKDASKADCRLGRREFDCSEEEKEEFFRFMRLIVGKNNSSEGNEDD